jgi:hypothetical protein
MLLRIGLMASADISIRLLLSFLFSTLFFVDGFDICMIFLSLILVSQCPAHFYYIHTILKIIIFYFTTIYIALLSYYYFSAHAPKELSNYSFGSKNQFMSL